MQRTRQHWQEVPLIVPPTGKPQRPISTLYRKLPPLSVVAAHSHNWGQLVYASTGVLDVTTPSGRYLVPPHRAVWVPPEHPHEISSIHGAEISSIYITIDEAQCLPNHCYVLAVSSLLRELILEALRQPTEYDWSGSSGRLFQTLRDQVVTATPVSLHLPLPNDSRLQTICTGLQNQPGSKRNLEQWSKLAGASSRTVQRLFLKETGLSFRSWRQQLRLQIALQHLATEHYSVTRVASDLGYESSSAFISMFQQQVGVTPGEYVKSLNLNPST